MSAISAYDVIVSEEARYHSKRLRIWAAIIALGAVGSLGAEWLAMAASLVIGFAIDAILLQRLRRQLRLATGLTAAQQAALVKGRN